MNHDSAGWQSSSKENGVPYGRTPRRRQWRLVRRGGRRRTRRREGGEIGRREASPKAGSETAVGTKQKGRLNVFLIRGRWLLLLMSAGLRKQLIGSCLIESWIRSGLAWLTRPELASRFNFVNWIRYLLCGLKSVNRLGFLDFLMGF